MSPEVTSRDAQVRLLDRPRAPVERAARQRPGRTGAARTVDRVARGSGAAGRWGLVFALVAVLVAVPVVVTAWPATDDDRSAAELRAAALASGNIPFSGYAESQGGLALPQTDQLGTVLAFCRSRTTMRVWWRGPSNNRVDVVTAAGETDTYRDTYGSWTWEYEPDRVTRTAASPLALPTAGDLLPNTLAIRLLSDADPAELSRIGAERVAGRDALGIRLRPAEPVSSIDRVDIWVDAATGLPLELLLTAKGAQNPAIDSRYLDVDPSEPAAAITDFTPPADATYRTGDDLGVLRRNSTHLPPATFPATLAGLPRRTIDGAPAGIAVYGRGVTLLTVVPLPGRLTRDLQQAADQDVTAVPDALGTRLSAGPIDILLVGRGGGSSYGLIGTVTIDALEQAARELPDLAGRP